MTATRSTSEGDEAGPHAPGWLGAAVVGVWLILLLAACAAETGPVAERSISAPSAGPVAGSGTGPDTQAAPFAGCAVLTAPPPHGAPAADRRESELPAVELPCFTGGQAIRLVDLRGPAVINLWASWCEPCRHELPVMQRLADNAAGRLHVVGVDTGDDREAAASFARAKRVSMPTLYDRKSRLLAAVGRVNLPVTIFVDSAGRDYVHPLPLDAAELSVLVRKHTGVTVAP